MSTEAKVETSNGTSETTSQSRLAALVGFEEEAADQQLLETNPRPETTNADNAEEDTILSPKDTPTVPPHWSKGTNKAYLVLAVSAVVALIGYMAMARIFSSPIKKASQSAQNLQDFPIPASEKEDQTAKIKASLALGKQVEAVKKLNQEYLQKNQPAKQSSAAKTEKPSPKPERQETPKTPRRSSSPQIIPRSVAQIPPPRVVAPPVKQPTVAATPEPSTDPLTNWHQLAQVGSYGQITTKAKESNNNLVKSTSQQSGTVQANDSFNRLPSTTRVADTDRVGSLQLPLETASTSRTEPTVRQNMETVSPKSELQQLELEEAAILSGQPLQTKVLQATTTVPARLVTPLFWSDDLRSTDTPQLALQLEQSLIAADGTNVIPSGTRLLAQVNNVSASGLVEATVTSVIDPQGKSDREITPGTIILQGDQGQPLIAKAKQQKQSRSRVNLGQVLEDVLNENYEDLPRNLEQRNNQNRVGSGTLWYLTAGEPIELFIKQTFEFNLP